MAKRLISTCLLALLSLSTNISAAENTKISSQQQIEISDMAGTSPAYAKQENDMAMAKETALKKEILWECSKIGNAICNHPIASVALISYLASSAIGWPLTVTSGMIMRYLKNKKIRSLESQVKVLNQNSAKKNTQQSATPSNANVETTKK